MGFVSEMYGWKYGTKNKKEDGSYKRKWCEVKMKNVKRDSSGSSRQWVYFEGG